MKYCGCNQCRKAGEINPHELFETYLLQRESAEQKDFTNILADNFSIGELDEMENEISSNDVEISADEYIEGIAKRIQSYIQDLYGE